MNIVKTALYALLASSLFVACKSQQIASEDKLPEPIIPIDQSNEYMGDTSSLVLLDEAPQEKAYVVASIKRTACYGKCPVYEAKVFSNGLVLFEGEQNTDKKGLFEAYVLEHQVDRLVAQADSAAFFDLAATYPTSGFTLHDLPNTEIFIKKDESEKTIVNNHNAPKQLRAYEIYFDDFLSALNWRAVAESEVE
ncbi:MAG: DUF6438 domain-containing protein [Bacteroidota bacterium]